MSDIKIKNPAILNQGNLYRLKKLMHSVKDGGEYTIGFLGGSITQGSLAEAPNRCYAYLVYKWWVKTFPNSQFHYINGGIGGTTSLYGTARVWKDVLMYQPDFIIVDFSVNDEPTEFFQETFEGVIRKIYTSEKDPAVIVLNNVFYNTGINAQEYHNAVATHYQIPCVSMRDSLYEQIKQKKLDRNSITEDNLHPNDKGHRLLAAEIINLLNCVYEELEEEEEMSNYPEQTLTMNRFENAKLYQIGNSKPMLKGFQVDTREKEGMLDLYKNGWIGRKQGDMITFEVIASCISIQYLKSITKPRPVAEVVIDDDRELAVRLDANFQETWGDCLYLETILTSEEKKKHKVEIKIVESHNGDKGEFYLVSLITD